MLFRLIGVSPSQHREHPSIELKCQLQGNTFRDAIYIPKCKNLTLKHTNLKQCLRQKLA
jgi:hypothetical protein